MRISKAITAVALSVALVGLLHSSADAGRSSNVRPPLVVDSLGNVVGPLFAFSIGTEVLLNIKGAWVAPNVSASGFPSNCGRFIYTSTDCSGTPYLEDTSSDTFLLNFYVSDGVLYYENRAAIETITPGSFNSSCAPVPCNALSPTPLPVAPMLSLNLSALFVPPFTIEVKGIHWPDPP